MATNNLIVKFRSINNNRGNKDATPYVIGNIKDRTIKLSTVFELNDLHEMQLFSPYMKFNPKLKEIPKNGLKDTTENEGIEGMLTDIDKMIFYTKEYIIAFKEWITGKRAYPNIPEEYLPLIFEYFIYKKIGIFSSSNTQVFESGAANTMFSHYGDEFKGIALIYEVSDNTRFKGIDYINNKHESVKMINPDDFHKIGEGNFDAVDNMYKKNNSWAYECEKRMLYPLKPDIDEIIKPNEIGLISADTVGLTLKEIYHTRWISDKNREILNESASSINIVEIHPNHGSFEFNDGNMLIKDRLKNLSAKCYQTCSA